MAVECGPTVPQILVNVVALAFGGLIGYLSSARISRLNARLAASVKFRAAVLNELGSIYPLPANWPADIDGFLRGSFPQLQVAVAEFRPFVPWWRRRAFDRAWGRYRNTYGREQDVQVYHHYEGFHDLPDPKAAFRHNVDVLLSFAR